MPTAKITNGFVNRMGSEKFGKDWYDESLKGFHVRVTQGGEKIYRYLYREAKGRGVKRRVETIGTSAELSADAARQLAQDIAYQVRRGSAPAAEREAERRKIPVADAWPIFIDSLKQRDRAAKTIKDYEQQYRLRIEPEFARHKVEALDRSMIARWHQCGHETPRSANLALAALSSFLSFCERTGYREGHNPCRSVVKFKERRRDAVFASDELARFLAALDEEEDEGLKIAFRLAITTGARGDEVRVAEWSHFRIEEGDEPIWKIPAETMKQREAHTYALIPGLAQMMREYRQTAPVLSHRWVFAGATPDAPRSELRHAFYRIQKRAGIVHKEGRAIHGFRHTYITALASGGHSASDLQTITGHKTIQAAMGYVKRARDDRLSEIATSTAETLVGGGRSQSAQIVTISDQTKG